MAPIGYLISMYEVEKILLPREKIKKGQAFQVKTRLKSYPDVVYTLRFNWNYKRNLWSMEVYKDDNLIIGSTVHIYWAYFDQRYLAFLFRNEGGEPVDITRQNLGDSIELVVRPGPDGRPPEDW